MIAWPRTLFWRLFSAQILLIVLAFGLSFAVMTRDLARVSAENVVDVWAPALHEVLDGGAALNEPQLTIPVRREVVLLRSAPPADAKSPMSSLRFIALRDELRRQGIPVEQIKVSGVIDDSVVWLKLAEPAPQPWVGVASNLEGPDYMRRGTGLVVAGLLLAAAVAALLSRMVAAPASRLARAVLAFGRDEAMPPLPQRGPQELRSLAATVARTFEQRRELETQRRLMLAGLSHDVRSPLARIRLASDLLPDGSAEVQDLKQRIQHDVALLDRLVGSFADFVRAEAGDFDLSVDLGAVLRDCAAAFGLPAQSVTVDGDVQLRSHGDLLRRAVDNLVDNALRYGAQPVRLSARRQGEQVHLEVFNAGEPIAADSIDRLRRPFERGESHRGTPGTGLGLAIVERISQRHGGRMIIQPLAQPRGTRVELVLQAT